MINTISRALFFGAILSATAFAGDSLTFRVEKKRLAAERTKTVSTQSSQERWAYHVIVENVAFKDLANVEVSYVLFFKNEIPGSPTGQAKSGKKTGTKTIVNFKASSKFDFDTEDAELTKSELIGGWSYDNGAKARAKATLIGIWLRASQNGTQIAEFSDPDSLKTKEKWP